MSARDAAIVDCGDWNEIVESVFVMMDFLCILKLTFSSLVVLRRSSLPSTTQRIPCITEKRHLRSARIGLVRSKPQSTANSFVTTLFALGILPVSILHPVSPLDPLLAPNRRSYDSTDSPSQQLMQE